MTSRKKGAAAAAAAVEKRGRSHKRGDIDQLRLASFRWVPANGAKSYLDDHPNTGEWV